MSKPVRGSLLHGTKARGRLEYVPSSQMRTIFFLGTYQRVVRVVQTFSREKQRIMKSVGGWRRPHSDSPLAEQNPSTLSLLSAVCFLFRVRHAAILRTLKFFAAHTTYLQAQLCQIEKKPRIP